MFEPGVSTAHGGARLAHWSENSGALFIGEPGRATHQAGHVLDLSFSNIPFAYTTIHPNLHCGSDHETLVTVIPAKGQTPLDQFHYRVPETKLALFSDLVGVGMAGLQRPRGAKDKKELEERIEKFTNLLTSAI